MSTKSGLSNPFMYGKHSLRHLAPKYWENDGKSLIIPSIIGSYGIGPIEKRIGGEVAQFIKENSRSSRRLRVMAISAYETIALSNRLESWRSVGSMTFIALTAGISALDAWACVLWGIVFSEVKKENAMPAMKNLEEKLRKLKHPLHVRVAALMDSRWFKMLREARNRVVHRGWWPEVGNAEDFFLFQQLEKFEFGGRTTSSDIPREGKRWPLDLSGIVRGLLCELQTWDVELEGILKSHAAYAPYVVGPTHFQYLVDGSPECDWLLGCETCSHTPTREFVEEFLRFQQEKSGSNDLS